MKQIITMNFGQPGINIADSTLDLYLRQHGMKLKNNCSQLKTQSLIDRKYNPVFFEEVSRNNLSYRSISVDCDPYSSGQLLVGANKTHYNKDRMIYSKQSTGGMYSRGFAISHRQLCQQVQNTLQKTLQNCDNLQGIIINASLLGGSSGVFHHVMTKIMGEEYLKKKIAISNLIFPSKDYSNSIVQIYNYTLAFRTLIQFSHLNIPYDNQSIYRMCQQAGIQNAGYRQINRFISNMQSSITLPFRSNGPLNSNLNELTTNLVCYPRINQTYPSFTPNINSQRLIMQTISVDQLTKNIFDPKSRMIDMRGTSSKIAVALYYRGDVTPYEVSKSLQKIKQSKSFNCKFEQWSPLGFKVGINLEQSLLLQSKSNHSLKRSCCSLTNSMEFNQMLGQNNYKFDTLFAKRAFVYAFIQDMTQEGQFVEARQDLAALQKDYQVWDGAYVEDQEDN